MNRMTTNLLAFIRKIGDHNSVILTLGLILHIIAYQTMFFKLSNYWFWLVNDMAIVCYFLFAYFAAVKLGDYVRLIASIGTSLSLAALVQDILGGEHEYKILPYIIFIITLCVCYWEYRQKP